jgi:hypothetical protein
VDNTNLYLTLVSAAGMMLVAIAAVVFWRRLTHLQYRWFWVGAGLWTVAVAIKFAIAIPTNGPIYRSLSGLLPPPSFVVVGSLYGRSNWHYCCWPLSAFRFSAGVTCAGADPIATKRR